MRVACYTQLPETPKGFGLQAISSHLRLLDDRALRTTLSQLRYAVALVSNQLSEYRHDMFELSR